MPSCIKTNYRRRNPGMSRDFHCSESRVRFIQRNDVISEAYNDVHQPKIMQRALLLFASILFLLRSSNADFYLLLFQNAIQLNIPMTPRTVPRLRCAQRWIFGGSFSPENWIYVELSRTCTYTGSWFHPHDDEFFRSGNWMIAQCA